MNEIKGSLWNPLTWISMIWEGFRAAVGDILRLFGLQTSPAFPQHAAVTPEDVGRAYDDATDKENQPDVRPEVDRRVDGFLRYVESSPEERAAFDLSAFDTGLQDFVLGLSEDDIAELRRRGPVGQLQAAILGKIPPGPEMQTAPVMPEPTKAELVRERFLRSVRGLPQESADDDYSLDYILRP